MTWSRGISFPKMPAVSPYLRKSLIIVGLHTVCPAAWPLLEILALLGQHGPASGLVPGPLRPALHRYSSTVLALGMLKALAARYLPEATRTVRMWRMFLPIWARCKWLKWRCREDRGFTKQQVEAAWAARHEKEAEAVYDMMLELSGLYIKSAQIMAAKNDFMPAPWVRQLAVCFDGMPPLPWSQVRRTLLADLAASPAGQLQAACGQAIMLESFLESVEARPMASASIAQVHGAVLAKGLADELGWRWQGGRGLVLKVQKGDMRDLMAADVRNLRRLSAFVADSLPFSPFPMLEEMAATVPKEFDFLREAQLMRVIAARLAAAGVRGVVVPEPLLALSTPRMLVMQRMPGVPLSRILERPIDAPLRARLRIAMVSLLDALGCSMLRHGLFQADPHAGNLLLQDDGTLVLLDFGQCKALSATRQRALAKLIIALDKGWPSGIVAALKGMGLDFKGKDGGTADPLLVTIVAYIIFDVRQLPEAEICPLDEDAVVKKIPLQHFAADLFLVGRAIMILRGLIHQLGLDLKAAQIWRKHAEAALKDPELEERAHLNACYDDGVVLDAQPAGGAQLG